MKEVEWTQSAIDDLASIFEHIAKDSPRYATHVVDCITNRTNQIATFPFTGAIVPEFQRNDIREVIEYSWRVIYSVGESRISILAVVHGAYPLPETPVIEH
jgi:addiction module RelE/StbE family toxin